MYESEYTPVIVNSIDGTYQPHFSSVNEQGQPLLYYNTGSTSMEPSLVEPNKMLTSHHFHQPHHLKSSSSPSASQTLPRRCSVGPLETNTQVPDGLYISFSKAPLNKAVNMQPKNYSSPMSTTKSAHLDCLQTSNLPVESVPLLGSNEMNNASLEQGSHSSPKPHEICLVSLVIFCNFVPKIFTLSAYLNSHPFYLFLFLPVFFVRCIITSSFIISCSPTLSVCFIAYSLN